MIQHCTVMCVGAAVCQNRLWERDWRDVGRVRRPTVVASVLRGDKGPVL